MSCIIEIKSPTITEVSGTSKLGKPYHLRKQTAWAYLMDSQGHPQPYPERIEFNLNEGQQPFAVGRYTVSPASFFVGDFFQLSIGRLILDPLK